MLYLNNFLEFCPDADTAEIDLNQTFIRKLSPAHQHSNLLEFTNVNVEVGCARFFNTALWWWIISFADR
jgi:hypothetical protein